MKERVSQQHCSVPYKQLFTICIRPKKLYSALAIKADVFFEGAVYSTVVDIRKITNLIYPTDENSQCGAGSVPQHRGGPT